MSSDDFGNGVPKNEDRFATQLGQYRPGGRREAGRSITDEVSSDHSGRNGSNVLDSSAPIASSLTAPKLPDAPPRKHEPAVRMHGGTTRNHESASRKHEVTLRKYDPLARSIESSEPWGETSGGTLADHPLLRGLLLELPPKGTVPEPEYLDRWFEAARSILDLLYAMSARA